MKKAILDQFPTKAGRREIKRRPRMKMHGRALLLAQTHGGKKISKK